MLPEKGLWLHTAIRLRQFAMCVLFRPSMHQTGKSHHSHDYIDYIIHVSFSPNAVSYYESVEY